MNLHLPLINPVELDLSKFHSASINFSTHFNQQFFTTTNKSS